MTNGRNNRGRIAKTGARGGSRGAPSSRGTSFRGVARGRTRTRPLAPREPKELMPNIAKIQQRVGNLPQEGQFQSAPVKPAIATDAAFPKVERIYNDIWASGARSFAFATHGGLNHCEDTVTLALNILDHIIRPENWNPELSHNKLSASCFFFASKLTGNKVTAPQVAASVWTDPSVAAGMSQTSEGPLYDRMLESLAVSAAQVAQGYRILYEQREELKDLLGGYSKEVAELPSPAAEERLLESQDSEGPYSPQIAGLTRSKGYQNGPEAASARETLRTELDEQPVQSQEESEIELDLAQREETEAVQSESVPQEQTEIDAVLDADDWNDFDTFVADNE